MKAARFNWNTQNKLLNDNFVHDKTTSNINNEKTNTLIVCTPTYKNYYENLPRTPYDQQRE